MQSTFNNTWLVKSIYHSNSYTIASFVCIKDRNGLSLIHLEVNCHSYCITNQASSPSSSAPEPGSQSPGYWVLIDLKLPAPKVIPSQKADSLLQPLTINPINPPVANASV